jgi:hypothetical protein
VTSTIGDACCACASPLHASVVLLPKTPSENSADLYVIALACANPKNCADDRLLVFNTRHDSTPVYDRKDSQWA